MPAARVRHRAQSGHRTALRDHREVRGRRGRGPIALRLDEDLEAWGRIRGERGDPVQQVYLVRRDRHGPALDGLERIARPHFDDLDDTVGDRTFGLRWTPSEQVVAKGCQAVSYTHLRAHETPEQLVC